MSRTTHTIHDDNVDILAAAIGKLAVVVAIIGLAIVLALLAPR